MVKFIREHWFGLILSVFVFVCLIITTLIGIAPHNDAEMRGFTPCTYQMTFEFNQMEKVKMRDVVESIGHGYSCYLGVMGEGVHAFLAGKQSTPWANYLFVPENIEEGNVDSEPFSEDLLKANVLDEDEKSDFLEQDDIKENNDA